PGADADVHTFCQSFRAEVGSPSPTSHIAIDGRIQRVDADFAVATHDDRLDVTGVELVEANDFAGDVGEIFDGEGQVHAIGLRGMDEALHVFADAENRGALLGFVAADALENSRAVTYDVGKDVNPRVIPVDEFSVVPDFLSLLNRHDLRSR